MSAARSLCLAVMVLACGCAGQGPEEPDYLRVVVDIDSKLVVPDELTSFTLDIERGDVHVFGGTYDQQMLDTLPQSLIVENPPPSNDSPEKQLTTVAPLYIKLVGYGPSGPRLWRTARVRFNAGQLQLGLPMCKDCLGVTCPTGSTCKRGACDSWTESPSDFDYEPQVDPLTECGP